MRQKILRILIYMFGWQAAPVGEWIQMTETTKAMRHEDGSIEWHATLTPEHPSGKFFF